MSAPLIPALSTAAVTEALSHLKSASTKNIQFTFTLQFKFIYFTQKYQSAVQLLSRPHTYREYSLAHLGYLVLNFATFSLNNVLQRMCTVHVRSTFRYPPQIIIAESHIWKSGRQQSVC